MSRSWLEEAEKKPYPGFENSKQSTSGSGDAIEPSPVQPGDLVFPGGTSLSKIAGRLASKIAMKKAVDMGKNWMYAPHHQKPNPEANWLDKMLVEAASAMRPAKPAPTSPFGAGPPAEYKRPMWGYTPDGEKKDLSPESQFIAEQSGIPREEVIEDSKRVYRDKPIRAEDLPQGTKFQTDLDATYGRTDEEA